MRRLKRSLWEQRGQRTRANRVDIAPLGQGDGVALVAEDLISLEDGRRRDVMAVEDPARLPVVHRAGLGVNVGHVNLCKEDERRVRRGLRTATRESDGHRHGVNFSETSGQKNAVMTGGRRVGQATVLQVL